MLTVCGSERENTLTNPLLPPCGKSYVQTHKQPQFSHPLQSTLLLFARCAPRLHYTSKLLRLNYSQTLTPSLSPFDRLTSPATVRVLPSDSSSTRSKKCAGEAQQLRAPTTTRNLRISRVPNCPFICSTDYKCYLYGAACCLRGKSTANPSIRCSHTRSNRQLLCLSGFLHEFEAKLYGCPTHIVSNLLLTRYKKSPPSFREPLNRSVSTHSPLHTY